MAAATYGQAFAYRPKAVFALPTARAFASPAFSPGVPEYLMPSDLAGLGTLLRSSPLYRFRRRTGGRHAEVLWNLIALPPGSLCSGGGEVP